MNNKIKIAKEILFGVSVADAFGVPFEFLSREDMIENPAIEMIGYGTYNVPKGTWSDDSSLTFCLADSLCDGFDLNSIAKKFVSWYENSEWTPYGKVFDIGIASKEAILNLINGVSPENSGAKEIRANGNGSLMRILPLALYLLDYKDINYRYLIVKKVSSITHAHFISIFSCFIYIEIALNLIKGLNKEESYIQAINSVKPYLEKEYSKTFAKILSGNIKNEIENNIKSMGYVIDSLEASLWCWLNTDNYKDAILKAVNLGNDTDTIAAITGGLTALTYGFDNIPKEWIDNLAKKEDIEELSERMNF